MGREAALAPLAAADVVAEGSRVEYRRPGMTEWYVNDARGVEHGFTLHAAPSGGAGPVVVEVGVSGGLASRVTGDGRGLVLSDPAGADVARYDGLVAFDARGADVPARMVVADQRVRLVVDDAGAVYPLTIDPLISTLQAKLIAADATPEDLLGQSVAVSGDTAVVGAPGVGTDPGSAYVFVRTAGTWTEQAKLTATDAGARDRFGSSVAVSGDTAVIGAPLDDDAGSESGAAYVFVRTAGTWAQQAKLVATDAAGGDEFGSSVAVSGDTAVIGAPFHDDAGPSSGSAYVFVRNGSAWAEQAELTATDLALDDRFGYSVAVSGDTAVIGAPFDNDAGDDSGSAYVFVRTAGTWSQQAKLTATDAAEFDKFGFSVAVSGDTAVIGAIGDNLEGVAGSDSGSAYVFLRTAGTWAQQAKLVGIDPEGFDQFGYSVAVSGETAVIGARLDDDAGSNSGSAYVFVLAKAPQAITFTSSAPANAVVGGTYTVTATGGGSGNPVVFTSATPATCTVSGATVSFVGAGTCTINANQAGNANYEAAPQVPQTFTVAKAQQAITFTSSAPANAVVGGTYTVTATGGASGNPVVFTSATPTTCTVSGATVSFVGAGTCTINANQAGNANYEAAPQVPQTFTVAKAPQAITFTSSPAGAVVGGTYTVTATGGGSGNPVTFTSATPAVCTVSGATVSFVGVGTCTINANQAGNANYEAASQAPQTFTVAKASASISTVASPGNLVGAPVRDTATVVGGFNPTGTVTFRLFSDASCATEVFTSTNPLGSPSDWFTPAAAGTYRWTAVYNGDANNNTATSPCNAPNESVTLTPFVPPAPTRTISGDLLGPVTVNAGESVVITAGARVVGLVTINPGGALAITGARVTRGIVVDNPSFLSICGTDVSGPPPATALSVSNAVVPIRIGDPATGCAGNRFAGQVTLTSNLAVTFGANAVSHNATVNNGGPGQTVVKANTVYGTLACSGNNPAPSNAGQPNTAGTKTGQRAGL